MFTKFLEGLGGKLADSWVASALTPAFLFWFGGLGTWLWANHDEDGLGELSRWIEDRDASVQIALLLAVTIIVGISAVVVARLDSSILRFLEGYWPPGFRKVGVRIAQLRSMWIDKKERRWQELTLKGIDNFSRQERDEYARLETYLARCPQDSFKRMPTRLGNILRSGEVAPRDRYGLASVACWPRLWLVMPESSKAELTAARSALDADVRVFAWGALFAVWVFWAFWAPLVALAICTWAIRAAQSSATVYSDLVIGAFDVHRDALYEALRWPLPTRPSSEQAHGEGLSSFLLRGPEAGMPGYTRPRN